METDAPHMARHHQFLLATVFFVIVSHEKQLAYLGACAGTDRTNNDRWWWHLQVQSKLIINKGMHFCYRLGDRSCGGDDYNNDDVAEAMACRTIILLKFF